MMYSWVPITCLLFAPAADPVGVAIPKLEKGQKFAVEAKRSHDLTINSIVNGNAGTQKDLMAPTWGFTETIEDLDKDGSPTKLRRSFGKAETVVGKQTKALAFQKADVVFVKKGNSWSAALADGTAITGIDHRLALGEFGELPPVPLALFIPPGPVVVGTSWKPDAKVALAAFAFGEYHTFDDAKVKTSAKLVKTYDKDGKRCGVIEYQLEVPIVSLKGQVLLPAEEGSVLKVEGTLDGCIDGTERRYTRTSKMTQKFATSTEIRGQAVQMSTVAEVTQSETVRPVSK